MDERIQSNARNFLNVFAASLTAAFIFILTIVVVNREEFPAPRISSSESFNEKATWVSKRLSSVPHPKTLIVGSSMGLNNIDGQILASYYDRGIAMNASSWGLSLTEICLLAKMLSSRSAPKTILIPVYHGDFMSGIQKNFDTVELEHLLDNGPTVSTYLRNLDLFYYSRTLYRQSERRKSGRRVYDSLEFDATGGVLLDCAGFNRIDARWNGFRADTFTQDMFAPAALDALAELGNFAAENDFLLCVAVCPMRPEAEVSVSQENRTLLWNMVRSIVEKAGGILILPKASSFTDADFADYCHLNRCGAETFSRFVGEAITTRSRSAEVRH